MSKTFKIGGNSDDNFTTECGGRGNATIRLIISHRSSVRRPFCHTPIATMSSPLRRTNPFCALYSHRKRNFKQATSKYL